jgi:hypothetical protein
MQTTRTSFRAPKAIFWTAFLLRLAVILVGHTYKIRVDGDHFNFGFEAGRIARSLVTGHGYANPFNGPSGPTAWLPPLYPLLIALAFKLFGLYSKGAAFFILATNSLFSALIAPAIYEIAARCFDANGIARRASKHVAPVALWSAWLWAVYPAFLQYAIHWIWEMSLTTCLFTWTLVLALRLRHIGERVQSSGPRAKTALHESDSASSPSEPWALNPGTWLVLGLLWGLIALSNTSLILVLPATIVWILWPALRQLPKLQRTDAALLKRGIAGTLLTIAFFAATLTPWIIRNERALHAFIPTRDNFGVELWQSSLFYHDAFEWGQAVPLDTRDPDYKLYASMGEVAYSHLRGEQAKANLRAHPGTFLRLTAKRIEFFWIGVPHPTEKHPSNEFFRLLNYCFLSVSGLLGLAFALKRRVPAAWLFASVFALVPVAYYVVTVQARFRHPIEPLIAILTVYLFRSTSARS